MSQGDVKAYHEATGDFPQLVVREGKVKKIIRYYEELGNKHLTPHLLSKKTDQLSRSLLQTRPSIYHNHNQELVITLPNPNKTLFSYVNKTGSQPVPIELTTHIPHRVKQLDTVFEARHSENESNKVNSQSPESLESLLENKRLSQLERPRPIKMHTYSPETQKNIHVELIKTIGESSLTDLITEMNSELQDETGLIYEAWKTEMQQRTNYLAGSTCINLMATPTGELYAEEQGYLGKGAFKSVVKSHLIASVNQETMNPLKTLETKAYSYVDYSRIEEKKTPQSLINERKICESLIKMRKEGKTLSNVIHVYRVDRLNSTFSKEKSKNEPIEMGFLTEFCDGGNVNDLLATHSSLSLAERLNIALQAAEGIKQLHEAGIIHGDLHLENLLRKNQVIKVSDFGLSLQMNEPGRAIGIEAFHASPEYIRYGLVTKASDIYQLGLIFFQLMNQLIRQDWEQLVCTTSQKAYEDVGLSDILKLNHRFGWIQPHWKSQVVGSVSEKLKDLIDWMLAPELDQRPTIETIIEILNKYPLALNGEVQ